MKNITDVNDADFDSLVVRSDLPALVDLWAEYCGPCRAIAPMVEEIAAQFEGKLKVFKLNTENNPETPFRFEVMSIPTLLLFKNGQLVESIAGYLPKAKLLSKIEPHLQGEP